MNNEIKNALIQKRYLELDSLGIKPELYYLAIKLIDRHVCVIIKNNSVHIFKKHEFKLHDNQARKDTSDLFKSEQIIGLLVGNIGLDSILAHNIYSEWIREKIIYIRMTENTSKNWDYLTLPSFYINLEVDEYVF